MKTYLIIFLIILFCGTHTYVTILLSNHDFEPRIVKLMVHVPLILFYTGLCTSEYTGDNTEASFQFQLLGKIIIFVFLLLYCLNYAGYIQGVTRKLSLFYGINLVGLCMLFICTLRHGNFKD